MASRMTTHTTTTTNITNGVARRGAGTTRPAGSGHDGWRGIASRLRALAGGLALSGALGLAGPGSAQAQPSLFDAVGTQVAAGGSHTCVTTTAGGVKCWGRNISGQLGDGTQIDRITPVDVLTAPGGAALIGVAAVAAGDLHTCALTSAGGVKCWGRNDNGQLGDGSQNERTAPVDVMDGASPLAGVAALVAGGYHTCALTTAGGVKCWGRNDHGQLGNNSSFDSLVPVTVTGLASGVVAVAAGGYHTCALTTAGGLKCWGDNNFGQLGNNTTTDSAAPGDVSGLASGVAAIAAGAHHTCAVTTGGAVQCWGWNFFGQLGNGTTAQQNAPVDVQSLTSGVVTVAAGFQHTCALTTAGGLKCWGYNLKGELGDGTQTQRTTPVVVLTTPGGAALGGVAGLAAGDVHTCALTSAGGVKCWGQNIYAELGDGTTTDRTTPVDVVGLSAGLTAMSAGGQHTCARTSAGGAACWGQNLSGQLGDGTTAQRNAPVDVFNLTGGIAAVAAGYLHTCALTATGGVKCWGANFHGQLGDGSWNERTAPVDVMDGASPLAGVAALVAGGFHTCALTTAGGVKCWGRNDKRQLGVNSSIDSEVPVTITGLASGVVAVAAGGYHTCALTSAGGVRCWGRNDSGQLGNNTTTDSAAPGIAPPGGEVSGLASGVAAIAAGAHHTCAVTTGGGVKCWGDNLSGQLGNGTTAQQNAPVDVQSLTSGVVAVAAGFQHTCALTTGGGVKCWGDNFYGQLGNNVTTSGATASPVDVSGLTSGVAAIAAGGLHTCALTSAGGVRCWGRNDSGRLGDGTQTDRITPVAILSGQSIAFTPPASLVAGGAGVTLSATASSGLGVSFDTWTPGTCTVNGTTVTATAPALCGLRVSQAGNGNNAPAPQQLRLVKVVPTYVVTASPGTNGNLSCASPVPEGETTTCTASPASGYRTLAISGCGGTATAAGVNSYTSGAITSACTVTASFEPWVAGVCGTASGTATPTAPSINLCAAGTASSVATNATHFTWVCAGTGGSGNCQLAVVCTGTGDTRICQPTWICTDTSGGSAFCSAPRQYAVTASAGPNGSLNCASPVTAGSTTTCTATPNTGYRTQSISGCGGTPTGPTVNGYATGAITGACMVTASFVANPLGNTSQGGAPFTGTTVPPQGGTSGPASASFTSADGGINCAFDPASTGFVAATAGYPVQGATLPHGMFRFKLAGCQPGFTARVTVNWPSLSGLQVLKYGKASAGAAASFFVPRSLVIRGNSVSFDVTDGQLGDDDWVVNGEIVDPVAAVREPPREVPVLGLPGLALLGALLMGFGMLGRFGARQRNGRRS